MANRRASGRMWIDGPGLDPPLEATAEDDPSTASSVSANVTPSVPLAC